MIYLNDNIAAGFEHIALGFNITTLTIEPHQNVHLNGSFFLDKQLGMASRAASIKRISFESIRFCFCVWERERASLSILLWLSVNGGMIKQSF